MGNAFDALKPMAAELKARHRERAEEKLRQEKVEQRIAQGTLEFLKEMNRTGVRAAQGVKLSSTSKDADISFAAAMKKAGVEPLGNDKRAQHEKKKPAPVPQQTIADNKAVLAESFRAYFAQMLALCDGLSDGGFAKGYVQLQIDGANLRAAVRTRRMAKDADFLKNALVSGGTIGTDRVLAAFESAEALTALYANTWLSDAASAGAAAMSGGALTAFELLCDNALMDYIRAAKLRSFGAAHVTAYLAAMENETTAARMILTGRLAGLQPAVIRERLRETYA